MGKIKSHKLKTGGANPGVVVGVVFALFLIFGPLIAWALGAFDSDDSEDKKKKGSNENNERSTTEGGGEEEPVECVWPNVLDEDNNVCVDAPPIPDGTVGTHGRCIEDSDCRSGRCSGPTGDPGCYGRHVCTAVRQVAHGGPAVAPNGMGRMGYCGGLPSASAAA